MTAPGEKPPDPTRLYALPPPDEVASDIRRRGPPRAEDILPSDDHATIAGELCKDIPGTIFTEEKFHRYEPASGCWREVLDRELVRIIISYSRRPYFAGTKTKELRIESTDVNGTIACTRGLLDHPDFFAGVRGRVGFSNGVVALSPNGTPVLLPHSPDNRIRYAHPFPYDPTASRAELNDFFDQLFADVSEEERTARVMLLQEFAGACLFGLAPTYQRCLILLGKGGQGKSQVLEILRAIFPTRASISSLPPHLWGEQFTLEILVGKLANLVDEIPETEIVAGAIFKSVITGDPVAAERKFQPKFDFRPIAGHVFSCNQLPSTADLTEGFFDRFLILPLTRKMRGSKAERPNAAAHVVASCPSALAYWAIEGASRLVTAGRYTVPPSSLGLGSVWRRDCDNVAIFASERCTPARQDLTLGPGNGTRSGSLYALYKSWAAASGFRPVSIRTFSARLENYGVDKAHARDGEYYALTPIVPDHDDP